LKLNDITIIKTNDSHYNDIIAVEKSAFGHDKEANLTAALLKDKTGEPLLSLLAYHEKKAVGHILFTRCYIDEMMTDQPLFHILAPLAVIPEYQKQGIGGLLMREGFNQLKEIGSLMIFLLGHIEYYPKHGFIPDARKYGYTTIYPIPKKVKDAWMFQPLTAEEFPIKKGRVLCCNELNRPEHWRE
jgi:putative acetyltransferase